MNPSGDYCSISDSWTYNGMRVVWMENKWIKVGILVDRGSDIFEFRFKPRDINMLLRLDKDIHNPRDIVSQLRDTPNQMEDYYYGGWQECLPNSAPILYRGASLGQHGEVWMIPWKHALTGRGPDCVSVTLWTQPLRVPITIEKTLTLEKNAQGISLQERLTNVGGTDLDLMWGHHIAFGLPFLNEGAVLDTNAGKVSVEEIMPEPRKFQAGMTADWPVLKTAAGEPVDASRIPSVKAPAYCDLAYLSNFKDSAYYSLHSDALDLSFQVEWDPSVFSSLWFWQERYATLDAPWWGKTYAVGIEPWTSRYFSDPEDAISKGELFRLSAGQSIETKLQAKVLSGQINA